MNEQELKIRFPRASRAFIEANVGGLYTQKFESVARSALGSSPPRKEKGDARISLSYVLYRVRLLDPDNAYGATKTLTDCLCQIGLLSGDSEMEIDLTVEQIKVNHYEEQRTVLTIKYP